MLHLLRTKNPSDGTRAAGIEYGYGIPAELAPGWDRELLADIFLQGKRRVDEHFGFAGKCPVERRGMRSQTKENAEL